MFNIQHFDRNGANFFFNSKCIELETDHNHSHKWTNSKKWTKVIS